MTSDAWAGEQRAASRGLAAALVRRSRVFIKVARRTDESEVG